MVGRTVRRDGLLVADTKPYEGEAHIMERQAKCTNSCSGHGTCIYSEFSSFPAVCHCFAMWSGHDCSTASCPNDCSGQGQCDPSNGFCNCNTHFGKADCSIDMRIGTCPEDCNGNGECVDGNCECYQGYSGISCREAPCPNNCTFNGVCADINLDFGGKMCMCNPGFKGEDCSQEIKVCPGSREPCNEHGKCNEETGVCECMRGWSGEDCSERDCVAGYLNRAGSAFPPPYASQGCPNDCSCHGYCVCSGDQPEAEAEGGDEPLSCYCACEPSWAGEACSFPIGVEDPFSGVIQPFPDAYQFPEVHPYLSDEERTAIALKRQELEEQQQRELAENGGDAEFNSHAAQ